MTTARLIEIYLHLHLHLHFKTMILLWATKCILIVDFIFSFKDALAFRSRCIKSLLVANPTRAVREAAFDHSRLKCLQRSVQRRVLIQLKIRIIENDDDELSESADTPPKFDSSAQVENILQQIATALVPYKVNNETDFNKERQDQAVVSIDEIKQRFEEIFSKVRQSNIPDAEKNQVFAEASMIISNAEDEVSSIKSAINVYGEKNILLTKVDKVPVYSTALAPIVVVRGKGAVTRRVNSICDDLGAVGSFRFLEADQLSVIREYDLKYALKGAKSVVIISDSENIETKNWLGQVHREEGP